MRDQSPGYAGRLQRGRYIAYFLGVSPWGRRARTDPFTHDLFRGVQLYLRLLPELGDRDADKRPDSRHPMDM